MTAEPDAATAAPDFPGWRRNLAFVWLGVFVGLLGANFVFPFIPFFIKELGVSDESKVAYWTGVTASVTGLSLTLTAPVWGALADRFGRKAMFLRALVGAGITIGLMGVARSVWQLVALRFVMGAFAGTMGAAAALVAANTPRPKVGYALGTLQTGLFAANMLGPVMGGLVAANLGIRESFFFCASLYGAASVLAFLFVREHARPSGAAGGRGSGRGGSILANLQAVVRERQAVVVLVLLFVLWLSTTYVRPVMPLSIDGFAGQDGAPPDRVHLTLFGWRTDMREEAATGFVFGIIGLTSTVAALAVAPVGQRVGYRNAVLGAALIAGLLYVPVALARNFTAFLFFFGAVGLFQGAMVPGTNALIAASSPEGKQGSAFGLAASMQSLALLVGPLAGGATAGKLGIEAVYVVIAAVLVLAAVVARPLIREPEVFAAGRGAAHVPQERPSGAE
ncbi:Tetracycline resistance protein, class C [bacterium HR29]|nr:Tetracycline resistance protein, class C [bacterium HR29]